MARGGGLVGRRVEPHGVRAVYKRQVQQCGVRPGRGVPDQQGGQHRAEGPGAHRRRHRLVEHGGEGGDARRAPQRVPALDGDVEHHPQRPEVRGRVALLAADPLGGDVLGRADQAARGGQTGRLPQRGDAEVGEHRCAVGAQQDVPRLDVAVLDPGGVGGAQRGQHAPAEPGRLGRRHRASGQPVVQRAAGDQFHDQPGVRVLGQVDDVMDRHHVRVAEPGQRTGLAKHPLAHDPRGLRIAVEQCGVGRADLLQRDVAVQHDVARPPHQPHASAAEPFEQFEAAVDELDVPSPCGHGGHRRARV